MARLRRSLRAVERTSQALVAVACSWGAVHSAAAQSCHGQSLAPSEHGAPDGLRAGVNFAGANFHTARYVGSFEMLAASLAWTSEPLVLSAEWAGYRLVRNGAKVSGLGDPALAARLRLLSEQRAGFRAGLGLVTGLPFGEPKKDLGMGHLMLTPNAWLEGGTEARYVQATAGFAQALGAHAGHHNHGAAPLVAPMTQQEWVATAAAGFELRERIVLEGQAALQVPVAASEAVRAQVSLAVLLPFATGSGAVYVSRPLLGDTYDWRLGSGLRWAL